MLLLHLLLLALLRLLQFHVSSDSTSFLWQAAGEAGEDGGAARMRPTRDT